MYNFGKRLEKVGKQLRISEPPVVFEYADENGVEQRVEMSSADFEKLLREISGKSKGLPVREGTGAAI